MQTLRIAQISDLHFAVPSYNPLQLFSKRWLGNLNALFSRNKVFCQGRLKTLIPLFKEHKITHVVITGDLSTTSHPKEFKKAEDFIKEVEHQGISVHALPGNHDNYTKQDYRKKTFYKFFPSTLKEQRICVKPLSHGVWLLILDTTLATSLISSHGVFFSEMERDLEKALESIPEGDKIIMANHFPLFDKEGPRKVLKRSEVLRNIIQKHPKIIFYLHGHTHTHCIADLRKSGFPIILDCGSTPHVKTGAFHIIELEKTTYRVKIYRWNEGWHFSEETIFHG